MRFLRWPTRLWGSQGIRRDAVYRGVFGRRIGLVLPGDVVGTYWLTLGLAALPAMGDMVGGLLVDVLPTTKRVLGIVLHITVGVLLVIATLELLPRITGASPAWATWLALLAGGGFFIATSQGITRLRGKFNPKGNDQIAWIIFFSTSIHLLGGGLMLGASVTIDRQLGWILALSRLMAHVPQGFATLAEFKHHRASRRHRLLLSMSFFVPMAIGATAGYWLLRGQSELAKLATLAFTTGILLTSVVEKIIPELFLGILNSPYSGQQRLHIFLSPVGSHFKARWICVGTAQPFKLNDSKQYSAGQTRVCPCNMRKTE